MSIVFGPINSRRFGKSLGVDLSPSTKQCNFDCLYCELKPAKVIDTQNSVVAVNEVISEIKKALLLHKDIDVLTITANGEPTIYPYLNELIDKIDAIKGDIKTLILSNGSTIYKKEIQNALLKLDSVKLSLDCATSKCFKKLDRASKSIDLEEIKKGMLEFANRYKGNLLIEVLIVEGINDSKAEIEQINNFLIELKPTRVDLSTIDRPPAYNIKPVSYDKLHQLSLLFHKSLNVAIASKTKSKSAKFNYTNEQILETLSRRPLTKDDIEILFNQESIDRFNKLFKGGKIKIAKVAGVEFFRVGD